MEWTILATIIPQLMMLVHVVPAQAKDLSKSSNNMCEDDDDCDQEGDEFCCFDLSSPSDWTNEQNTWRKKCCTNPSGSPITQPPDNLTHPQMDKVTSADQASHNLTYFSWTRASPTWHHSYLTL
jgi:hypothetical protein